MKIKMNGFSKKNKVEDDNNKKKNNIEEELNQKRRKAPLEDKEANDGEEDNESLTEEKLNNRREYKRKGANNNYYRYKIKQYFKNLFRNRQSLPAGYYALLFAMVVLGAISVVLTVKSYRSIAKESYSVYGSIDSGKTDDENGKEQEAQNTQTDESSIQSNNGESNSSQDDKVIQTSTNVDKNNAENKEAKEEKKVVVPVIVPLKFIKPVDGEILKPYSIDNVIYSKTLELWKTHDGVDIAGDIGTNVKSMERGKVEKIYNDAFYGTTIIIDHGQGYKSQYSNLAEEVTVKEKQTIKKGDTIGKIGATAIGEIKDQPHLHIQLFKDGISINPDDKF